MIWCQICKVRPSEYTLPSENKMGQSVEVCSHCMKEVFDKVMKERSEATVQ